MAAADPYKTLGVARTASDADIKKAYRKLAKELHPDRNKNNPKASERFSQTTAAYDLLQDKDKRARFDRGEIDGDGNPAAPFGFGAGGGGRPGQGGGFRPGPGGGFEFNGGGEGVDVGDLFENLFNGGRAQPGGGGFAGGFGGFGRRPQPKGSNVLYKHAVSFVDAALGTPQRVSFADGSAVELKLPAGLESGMQVRVAGKGEPGPGGNGDAIVTLDIMAHRFFTRDGDDIRLDLPITLKEAVLGGTVRAPTVEKPVNLTIAKGSSSGRVLRLKGKGFGKKEGGRGDQLVTLTVQVPADDAALTGFIENWKGDQGNPRASLGV